LAAILALNFAALIMCAIGDLVDAVVGFDVESELAPFGFLQSNLDGDSQIAFALTSKNCLCHSR